MIGGSIPEADNTPTECVFEHKKVCSSPNELHLIKKFLTKQGVIAGGNNNDIINIAKAYLKVDKESEIWEHPDFKNYVGDREARQIVKKIFKPEGPGHSTALLDNFNIDNVLSQWATNSKELFNKKFYHMKFQMIDFARTGSELSNFDLANLLNDGYDCFGVVLNTDVSTGRGKHWFCMYGDFSADLGTKENPYTLEYFNSSGNPAMDAIDRWMHEAVHKFHKNTDKRCKIVRSAPMRIQYSNTECGVFCLMYIKSRLRGHPIDWFYKVNADDNDMINLRKHLFR
jgi:hypothetical protein